MVRIPHWFPDIYSGNEMRPDIKIDDRPWRWVKFHTRRKAHLHPQVICVRNERNPPMGFRYLLRKRNATKYKVDGWPFKWVKMHTHRKAHLYP